MPHFGGSGNERPKVRDRTPRLNAEIEFDINLGLGIGKDLDDLNEMSERTWHHYKEWWQKNGTWEPFVSQAVADQMARDQQRQTPTRM